MRDKFEITTLEGEKKIVQFFNSIDDLPIKRYQLIQKYILIDLNIGSSFSDILKHLQKFDSFIEVKDYESLAIERENMLMNYNFLLEGEVTKSYVLASFIKSINGVQVDVTEESIEDYVDLIENSDLKVSDLRSLTESQKKSLVSS